MTRRSSVLLLGLLAASALGCRFEVRTPGEAARDRDAVRSVVARLHAALRAGQEELAQGLFWPGATVELAPGGTAGWLVPAEGALPRVYAGVDEVTPVRSEVRLAGDRAVAIVELRLNPGTPTEREGTELVHLRRVAGIWRLTHFSPAP